MTDLDDKAIRDLILSDVQAREWCAAQVARLPISKRYMHWWRMSNDASQPDSIRCECEAFVLLHILAGLVIVGVFVWAVR